MYAQKELALASDQDAPEVKGRAKRAEKGRPPREDDPATVSTSTVQPPIKRQDDDPKEIPPFDGERPALREPDPAKPTENKLIVPIDRPDPDPGPVVPRQPGHEREEV